MIYITSDLHGDFRKIGRFCQAMNTTKEDILFHLGDLQINYYSKRDKKGRLIGCDDYDADNKAYLESLPITIADVRGNHENRPEHVEGYHLCEWQGGLVYVQDEYPSIKLAKTGEIYQINGMRVMTIGGAVSPDRISRIKDGRFYCLDEQVTSQEVNLVERRLEQNGWKMDVILSHTAPIKYQPREAFLTGMKQYMIDTFMEWWLDKLEEKLEYQHWYAGHYHIDKDVDRMHFVYERFLEFPSGESVEKKE